MGNSQQKNYKIRNQRHAVLGSYTKEEILNRIAQGKYIGHEEIAVEPFLEWHKVSSHPEFYDAFLKRLYSSQYKGVDRTSLNNPGESPKDDISSDEQPAVQRDREESIQATQQLGPMDQALGNKELAEEEINELFSNEDDEPAERSQAFLRTAEQVFDAPADSLAVELNENTQPVLIGKPLSSGELSNFSETNFEDSFKQVPNVAHKRKVLYLGLAVALLLLYLLGQGGDDQQQNVAQIGNSKEATSSNFLLSESDQRAVKKEELIEALLEEANHFYDRDTALHYLGALALYQEALDLNRQDPSLLAQVVLTKAHIYEQNPFRKEDLKELEDLILKGRAVEPQKNAFYRAEAIVAFAQKNLDLALERIRYARESDPTDVESVAIEAEILNEMGDRNSALEKILEIANQNTKKLRVFYVAARVALDIGQFEKAISYTSAALLINPMHANTHYLLGEAYQKARKIRPAIAHLDLVTKLAPLASKSVLADAHFSLAKLLELQNNVYEASKHNKLAYYFSNGMLPGINERIGADDKDIAELKKLANDQEYGADFYNARAEEFSADGNNITALEYLQVVRLRSPENPAPLVRVADLLERLSISYEKLKRVEILYLRAIKKDPNYIDSYCKLAALETEQYNFDSAYQLLIKAGAVLGVKELTGFITKGCQEAGDLSSESAEEYKVYIALAKHFFKRENYVCAAAFLKQARVSSPVNSEIFFYSGKLTEVYTGENLAEAARYYYQAVSTDAENYEALAGWARAKTKLGEKNYVVRYIRALLEREPQNPQLFWVLGEAYAGNQEFQRAITFYKKALDYNNRFSKARVSLARALSAVGQTYQAVNEYSYAASTDRRNGIGFFEAAQLQTINKKYDEAELLVKELIETTPNYPGSHRLLSQIYQFQGRKDEAISEMLIEVKNNPQNTKFTSELAEIYVKYQEFEKAVAVLTKLTNLPGETKAPEFRVDRTQALLLLSRCYRELKRAENAEGAIRLALDVDPNDPELHRELGYVYLALQRNREGVKEFEIYIQRNPAGADVENIKRLIKTMAIEE